MSLKDQAYKLSQHSQKESTMASIKVRTMCYMTTTMLLLWGAAILTGLISS